MIFTRELTLDGKPTILIVNTAFVSYHRNSFYENNGLIIRSGKLAQQIRATSLRLRVNAKPSRLLTKSLGYDVIVKRKRI